MHLRYFIFVSVYFYAVALPGSNEPEPTKANDYLLYKWGLWCEINDANHDQSLSLEDAKLMGKYYTDRNLSDVGSKFKRLFTDYYLGSSLNLSCDDFVEILKTNYERNQTNFVQKTEKLNIEWLETDDLNGDKFLSEEEYLNDWQAFGHNNKSQEDEFYRNHRLVGGRVTLDEAVDVWQRFETEKDRSKTDIVLNVIESGIL